MVTELNKFNDSKESAEYWFKFGMAFLMTFLFSIVWFMIWARGFIVGLAMLLILWGSFLILASMYHAIYRKRFRERDSND